MGNFDDISKTQENNIVNNYFHQVKKDNTKKIKCKEKAFVNFVNSSIHNKSPLYSNFYYSKTVKSKNDISFWPKSKNAITKIISNVLLFFSF